MYLIEIKPKMVYPHSRQFPFDAVAEDIVKELEKRNWKVPGITVDFNDVGSGEAKYKYVHCIKGENFKLVFRRRQGDLDSRRYDIAALAEIGIPKQMLEVYEDESGPRLWLYVGDDWEKDKEWFFNSIKFHSKLNNEPRRYLMYSGGYCEIRATTLNHDNDLKREYDPIGDEPRYFNLEEKFMEFRTWIKENVLNYILQFEEASVLESLAKPEEVIPYKGIWPTIYTICNGLNAEKITEVKEGSSKLKPEEKYALETCTWCDPNQDGNVTQNLELIPEVIRHENVGCFWSAYVLAIKLEYANHVYVVDNALYEKTRKKIFKQIAPRTRLTNGEIQQAFDARSKSRVPINEYKGGFDEPIVWIERDLEFSEIQEILCEIDLDD